MKSIATNKLIIAVLAAGVLGILFGAIFPGLMLAFSFIADLFVNVLQLIFIPLVASAIITGVSAFASSRQVLRAALSTLFLFLGTTIAAIIIGMVLVVIFKPGVGINTGTAFIPSEISNAPLAHSLDFINELVPSNIAASVMQGKFLGWMLVLTVAAGILGTLGQRARPLIDFFEVIYTVIQKVLEKLMYFIPLGIFFVIGAVIARNSGYFGSITGALGKLSLVLLIAFLIHAFVVVPLLLKYLTHRSPLRYFSNVFPALKTALATSSPTAALPVTYENSTERNNIDKRLAALVLPIGSSLNVNGRALYVTVCAIFIAQAFGIDLGFAGVLYVGMASMFFSLGTAVVPFAAMLALVAVFDSAGFSNAAYGGIGLVFVIDWFWSRVFAALDVWSDTAVAAVVEENLIGDARRVDQPFRSSRQRFERGRPHRDYRHRDSGREYKGRDRRYERSGQRPYSRPEREPVRSSESFSQTTPYKSRQKRGEKPPSPFELKADKGFDIEAAKTGESQTEDASPIVKKDSMPDRRDRRKIREKKKFTHGRETSDSEVPKKRSKSKESSGKSKDETKSLTDAVAPPPLIRDIETPTPSKSPVESKGTGDPKEALTSEPTAKEKSAEKKSEKEKIEEVQTSLFGRGPQRKSPRPKSGAESKPVEDTETYPKENQEFGRSTKRKKSK